MHLSALELSRLRATFTAFMQRDGFTHEQAASELSILLVNDRPVLRDHYLTARRTGQSFPLNRQQRASVYMTFENAINHATFA
jgi:hypothetical protein